MFNEYKSLINVKTGLYGIVLPKPNDINVYNRILIRLYNVKEYIERIFYQIQIKDSVFDKQIGIFILNNFNQKNDNVNLYVKIFAENIKLKNIFVENFIFEYKFTNNDFSLIFYI